MNINGEFISLEGGETYLTERETDAFMVKSGTVLVYAVPLRNGKAGRRSYIYTAKKGEVIPAFSYRDIEYCEWRFCFAPLEKAKLQCIPDGSTKRLRAVFSEKADIKNCEKEGFCGGIVDRYRLNTVTEDSFIIRTHNKRDEAAENINTLICDALKKNKETLGGNQCRNTEKTDTQRFSVKDILAFCSGKIKPTDVIILIVSSVLLCACTGIFPFIVSFLSGTSFAAQEKKYFFGCVGVALLIFISVIAALFVNRLSAERIAQKTAYGIEKSVFSKIFSLSEDFFRKTDTSELAGAVLRTGQCVRNCLQALISIFCTVFLVFILIICSGVFSLRLTAAGLVLVLPFACLYALCTFYSTRYGQKKLKHRSKCSALIYQLIGGIEKIRIAGVEDRALYEYLKNYIGEIDAQEKKDGFISGRYILRMLFSFSFIAVFLLIINPEKQNITTDIFAGFITVFAFLSFFIAETIESVDIYLAQINILKKSRFILESVPEDDENKEKLSVFNGAIEIKNVSFTYSEKEAEVLKNVSISIKPGEYVGITGASGCGKSTLMKLLTGFERPCSGKIYYDNKDIENIDKTSVRKHTGVVLQDGKLISGSIFENITVTNPFASMADVKRVAEQVGLDKEIASMPMGYHTVLSEDSDTLSGGQKQRILIARALINSPSLLLFDEATSALDNTSQQKICETLETLSSTKIVIAHRLSTLKNCDRIIVLDKGRVAEEGSYAFLMENGVLFPQIAGRQLI